MNFERAINSALPLIAALTLIAGCALPREVSKTPRSATEQLLLTHAVQRALADVTVPLPEGATVAVEVSGLQTDRAHVHMQKEGDFGIIDAPSWDLSFVRDAVAARLGERGYHIKKYAGEATYLVRVMVLALGTNQGNTFFGLPPIQSVIIPFSLPQITLYQELDQLAHARLYLDIYEAATGRFVRSTPWTTGNAYYNQYTVLFFFTFRTTDILQAP
jgi:hypothetical protein